MQEVIGTGPRGRGQEEEISDRLGMASVLTPARALRGHPYGNALLSRLPVKHHGGYDLTQDGFEPRLLQRVDISLQGHRVHIYNVHLGTSRRERTRQAKKLIDCLSDPAARGPWGRFACRSLREAGRGRAGEWGGAGGQGVAYAYM